MWFIAWACVHIYVGKWSVGIGNQLCIKSGFYLLGQLHGFQTYIHCISKTLIDICNTCLPLNQSTPYSLTWIGICWPILVFWKSVHASSAWPFNNLAEVVLGIIGLFMGLLSLSSITNLLMNYIWKANFCIISSKNFLTVSCKI